MLTLDEMNTDSVFDSNLKRLYKVALLSCFWMKNPSPAMAAAFEGEITALIRPQRPPQKMPGIPQIQKETA